jgi:MFS family permease
MLQLFKDKNLVRLCFASFFMSANLQVVMLSTPFIVKSMNGSDTDVGICMMAQTVVYVFCCILAMFVADKLKPRKILLIASLFETLISCGIFAVIWTRSDLLVSPIFKLTLLSGTIGISTAFFWPLIMGWVSRGHEGAELTKRFGLFNIAWGLANMMLPLIGGYMLEINYILPVGLAIILMAMGYLAIYFVTDGNEKPIIITTTDDNTLIGEVNPLNRQFVWISRVALFSTYTCIGIYRGQLGIFYKFELGFGEAAFGWAISMMCLFNVAFFYILGRSHWWHYKKGLYVSSQVLIIICMITIILTKNFFMQIAAAAFTGITYSVVYVSHQFYSVSGGKMRSRRTAIHESIIGAGCSLGSIAGGLVSDHWGRLWPYIFGCILVAIAGAAQIMLWFSLTQKDQIASKAKTSFLTSPT